jgi:hypothetical protein
VKVLKRVDYSDWRHRVRCPRCTSELEAEPSDVRAQHHEGDNDPRTPSPAYYTYHCTCAVCHQDLVIAKDDVPAAMQHFLQEKARHSTWSGDGKD